MYVRLLFKENTTGSVRRDFYSLCYLLFLFVIFYLKFPHSPHTSPIKKQMINSCFFSIIMKIMFNRRLTGVSDYEMLLTAQHRLSQTFVLMSFYAQKHI